MTCGMQNRLEWVAERVITSECEGDNMWSSPLFNYSGTVKTLLKKHESFIASLFPEVAPAVARNLLEFHIERAFRMSKDKLYRRIRETRAYGMKWKDRMSLLYGGNHGGAK